MLKILVVLTFLVLSLPLGVFGQNIVHSFCQPDFAPTDSSCQFWVINPDSRVLMNTTGYLLSELRLSKPIPSINVTMYFMKADPETGCVKSFSKVPCTYTKVPNNPNDYWIQATENIALDPTKAVQSFNITVTGFGPLGSSTNRLPGNVITVTKTVIVYIETPTVQVVTFPPPVVVPGTITGITDLDGARKEGAPWKFMSIWGKDLCALRTVLPLPPSIAFNPPYPTTLGGCQVLVDGGLVLLSFAWTNSLEGGTQINFLLPEGFVAGNHSLIVNKMDGNVVFVSKTIPFSFTSVESSPTFFHPLNYPITLQNASHDSVLVSGDTPAKAGDTLVAYSTGLGKGKVSITVNGRDAGLQYAGPQGTYPGLDQYNFTIPTDVVPVGGLGTLTITVSGMVQTFMFNLTN